MTATRKRTSIVNAFGFLGYLSAILQWCWSGLVLAYPYLQSATLAPPQKASPTAQAIAADPVLSPIIWIVSLVVTVVILGVCVVLIWRLPRAVGRGGAQLTHGPAKKATTLILKHQHLRPTKKRQLRLTYRLVLLLKVCIVIIPIIALVATHNPPLSLEIIWTIGWWCFGWSVVFFVAQHFLGKLFRVSTDAIW